MTINHHLTLLTTQTGKAIIKEGYPSEIGFKVKNRYFTLYPIEGEVTKSDAPKAKKLFNVEEWDAERVKEIEAFLDFKVSDAKKAGELETNRGNFSRSTNHKLYNLITLWVKLKQRGLKLDINLPKPPKKEAMGREKESFTH